MSADVFNVAEIIGQIVRGTPFALDYIQKTYEERSATNNEYWYPDQSKIDAEINEIVNSCSSDVEKGLWMLVKRMMQFDPNTRISTKSACREIDALAKKTFNLS